MKDSTDRRYLISAFSDPSEMNLASSHEQILDIKFSNN